MNDVERSKIENSIAGLRESIKRLRYELKNRDDMTIPMRLTAHEMIAEYENRVEKLERELERGDE